MKTKILLLLTLTILNLGCKKPSSSQIAQKENKVRDYEKPAELLLYSKNPNDSIKQTFLNSKNEKDSPIKIISSRISTNEYTTHKDIKIVYKNIGKKNIKAIKMEWYCENSFDEPSHGKFFFIQGKSTANITKLLKAGTIKTQVWEDFSTDANTIIKTRAYFVMFTDGTTWQLTP